MKRKTRTVCALCVLLILLFAMPLDASAAAVATVSINGGEAVEIEEGTALKTVLDANAHDGDSIVVNIPEGSTLDGGYTAAFNIAASSISFTGAGSFYPNSAAAGGSQTMYFNGVTALVEGIDFNGTIYGGGSGGDLATSSVTVRGGASVFGSVYAGNDASGTVGNAAVTVNGASVSGGVYGGDANVTSVSIRITEATVSVSSGSAAGGTIVIYGASGIPAGGFITVGSGCSMTVSEGAALTINETAAVSIAEGVTVTNYGTITDNSASGYEWPATTPTTTTTTATTTTTTTTTTTVPANVSYMITIPARLNFGTLDRESGWKTVFPFTIGINNAVTEQNSKVTVSVYNADYTMQIDGGSATLRYWLYNSLDGGTPLGANDVFCVFVNGTPGVGETALESGTASVSGCATTDASALTRAGIYRDVLLFRCVYSEA